MKIKLSKQSYGAGFALGIAGVKADIEQFGNLLFNYGITGSSIDWTSDAFNFGSVLIFDTPKFEKFLTERGMGDLLAGMADDSFIKVAPMKSYHPYKVVSLHGE